MENYIKHTESCRTAVRQGQPVPSTPGHESIGHAEVLMKHVSAGKRSMKWTEEDTVELRKKLYGGDTLFGNYTIWATLSPDDLRDIIAAAMAGYTYGDPTPFAEQSSSSSNEYSADDLAETIASNPVACARAFRNQLEIWVKHILGWNLKTGRSTEGAIGLVQAFSIQVSHPDTYLCNGTCFQNQLNTQSHAICHMHACHLPHRHTSPGTFQLAQWHMPPSCFTPIRRTYAC
jgi:hypothetical protein